MYVPNYDDLRFGTQILSLGITVTYFVIKTGGGTESHSMVCVSGNTGNFTHLSTVGGAVRSVASLLTSPGLKRLSMNVLHFSAKSV